MEPSSLYQPTNPVEAFVVYAHEDRQFTEELVKHLAVLQRTGLIAAWHDGLITAGSDWNAEIRHRLERSEIILLLISPDFAGSDFCIRVEAKRALERQREKQAVVIPVIIRPTDGWQELRIEELALGSLQSVPRDGTPISSFPPPNHDGGWVQVTSEIRRALHEKLKISVHPPIVPRVGPQGPGEQFVERLADADELTIVGLTNENLVRHLERALRKRQRQGKGFWTSLMVVFASKEFLDKLPEERSTSGTSRTPDQRSALLEAGKSAVARFLLAHGKDCPEQWSCHEYPGQLPFVGCLFRVGDQSLLRIALILPGIDMKEAFYIELASGSTPFFEQLHKALTIVCNNSTPLVEWVLRGRGERHTYAVDGLVNLTRLDAAWDACVPVVLVILNLRGAQGRVALLQKRTLYNAADKFETYSNLSGWVTDRDLLDALDVIPTPNYLARSYEKKNSDAGAWENFMILTGHGEVEMSLDPTQDGLCRRMYEAAARRELYQELGLMSEEIVNLNFQRYFHYNKNPGPHLLFGIFSLELTHEQINQIRIRRPYAELRPFSCADLHQAHDNILFNRLLQARFADLFLPIFKSLEICHD